MKKVIDVSRLQSILDEAQATTKIRLNREDFKYSASFNALLKSLRIYSPPNVSSIEFLIVVKNVWMKPKVGKSKPSPEKPKTP